MVAVSLATRPHEYIHKSLASMRYTIPQGDLHGWGTSICELGLVKMSWEDPSNPCANEADNSRKILFVCCARPFFDTENSK